MIELPNFEPAAPIDNDPQRGETRDSLFLAGRLTVDGLPPEQVRIRNLSARGVMAEYPSPVDAGVAIRLDLRGIGEITGRIAWAAAGRVGIAFDRPIDPKRARKAIGASRDGQR